MILATLPPSPPLSLPFAAPVYRLVAKYKLGEKHVHHIQTTIAGMGGPGKAIRLEFDLVTKVLKVQPQGSTISLSFAHFRSGINKLPNLYGDSTVTLDKTNKPVGASHTGQVFIMFAPTALPIGGKWSGLSNLMAPGKTGANVMTDYKLGGIKTERGRTIASLSMSIQGTTPGEGTALVDTADGTLLSEVLKVTIPDKKAGTSFPVEIIIRRMS